MDCHNVSINCKKSFSAILTPGSVDDFVCYQNTLPIVIRICSFKIIQLFFTDIQKTVLLNYFFSDKWIMAYLVMYFMSNVGEDLQNE